MVSGTQPVAVCLIGPTAAGKTDLGARLIKKFPFEIISVDSAMVYRQMDIGTAKPDADFLREVPHRLIDIRDPWESYSAAEFCKDARRHMVEIKAAGRVPLLVGGTLLYFRALQEGLAPMPSADPDLRRELDERAAVEGWPALHQELGRVDPAAAERIAPGDRQRIQRALEVFLITGEPITALQRTVTRQDPTEFIRVVLVPGDRATLYRRIETRFARMMAAGFLDEVERLRNIPAMSSERQAMRAVGYRQLWQHLAGELSRQESEHQALVATRRLAKRQLTWLRSETNVLQFDCLSPDVGEQVEQTIRQTRLFDA